MNKNEYLQELRKELNSFSREERDSAISYYEEFFDEAGSDNEQAVIASLGDPKTLAGAILKESGVDSENSTNAGFTPPQNTGKSPTAKENDNSRNVLVILLIILSSPIWGGFVAGAFTALAVVIATAFAITFGILVASVVLIAAGIFFLFSFAPTGLFLLGVGLVLLGTSILIIFPIFKFFISILISGFKWVIDCVKKLFSRSEVNA